jgi:protein phosphatase
MSDNLRYSGLSDVGLVRKRNEDSWNADPAGGLFIVADGMGGHLSGNVASRIVVEALPPLIFACLDGVMDISSDEAAENVCGAISRLSERMRAESDGKPGFSGMGSTLVMALIRDGAALVAHLGDSRAYIFRNGVLRMLTRDHSVVQFLYDAGEITFDEMEKHPAKNQITRYVGMGGEAEAEARAFPLVPGDRILLCSDGLTGMVEEARIANVLFSELDTELACHKLANLANESGGKDNITVIILDWMGTDNSIGIDEYKTTVILPTEIS